MLFLEVNPEHGFPHTYLGQVIDTVTGQAEYWIARYVVSGGGRMRPYRRVTNYAPNHITMTFGGEP